jgi:hypothetical protein
MSAPSHDDFEDRLKYAPPWARHAGSEAPEPAQETARDVDRPLPSHLPSAPSTVPRAYEREPDWRAPESGFEGDIAIRRLQRRMSLDPQPVREPVRDRPRATPRKIARLAGVMLVAAAVAFALVMLAFPPGEPSAPPTRSASLAPEALVAKSDRGPLPDSVPARPDAVPDPAPVAAPAATSAAASAAAPAAPAPPSSTREASLPAQPSLDPEEIAVLLRRGQDFFANGDLASARLMFRRAAEAGDARAALSLGATFDPNVLGKLPVLGAAPDIAQARTWYRRAAELGSAEASRRIEQLTDAR